MDSRTDFLAAIINTFEANKRLAERAVTQVADDRLHVALDEHTNSIAVIMKHVAGNLISRWSEFLTTDGEKPWRNRDEEFVDTFGSRAELMKYWEQGWFCLFTTLHGLTPADLTQTVTIRGEPHPVPLAIARSLGHTCYHVGQMVHVARIQSGATWQTLTIPRGQGQSEQFNRTELGNVRKVTFLVEARGSLRGARTRVLKRRSPLGVGVWQRYDIG